MFSLWKKIHETLIADNDIKSLMGIKPNIRRQFQRKPLDLPQIVFHEATPSGPLVEGTPLIEDLSFIITTFAETDKAVSDICRAVTKALHGADLSDTDIHSYLCDWRSWLIGIEWDREADAWRRDFDFRVVVRRIVVQ